MASSSPWRQLLTIVTWAHICSRSLLNSEDISAEPHHCARALLLVAHADDETLFAGEALLGRKASLPGGCRRALWHVVTVTSSPDDKDDQRRRELRFVMNVARQHGLAAGIIEEAWDFEDCNSEVCGEFQTRGSMSFRDRLVELLGRHPWDFVVTHNEQGEYHHAQHVGLHNAVRAALSEGHADRGGKQPAMLVFNPIPEVNVSLSLGKRRMLNVYLQMTPTRARQMVFDSLTQYSEHLVPVNLFQRPQPLQPLFFLGITQVADLHFQYAWALVPSRPWGDFDIDGCKQQLQIYLDNTLSLSCGSGSHRAHLPHYPEICQALTREVGGLSARLRNQLDAMVQMDVAQEELPEVPMHPPTLRCLSTSPPVGVHGSILGWEINAKASGVSYIEMLAVRPILVGWKQGYKGRAYKIIGSSGPRLLSPSITLVETAKLSQPTPIEVQPDDVIGWGFYTNIADVNSLSPLPRGEQAPQLCLGAKGCDESGLCIFDTPPPDDPALNVKVVKVSASVAPAAVRAPLGPGPFYKVLEALDISALVDRSTSYEELLTLRQRLEHPDLGLFEDKIRLRQELLPAAGVLSTPSIHLSNTDFDIARFLHGRRSFVVKPSHMSESQNVFVVQDGINLLQRAWGYPNPVSSIEDIQAAVNEFTKQTALDWECRALVSSKPGVVVEELVLAQDQQGMHLVDEYKFYVSWGLVMFGENVPFSSGSVMEISRSGEILTTKMSCPPFCVAPCYSRMVEVAERVAKHARTDYLRVDLLVSGRCEDVFVSEVELFPASDFSQALKDTIAERWRRGYNIV
eukprot:TRINITY_DN93704_c0_g1_i1.p1 TRINITY_DN93704_c0_g1~~TRINITY_DN93704_c0_g1_i1.p1  ORF type:complete len:799 (+),score=137.81 TRINITY_DN93704_c0_g1_i1:35-2431(+)